jgi:mannose-6-phosphate isomerase
MALAITPFGALCGFRPLSAIATSLSQTPELASLVPPTIAERFSLAVSSSDEPSRKASLRDVFAAIMTADAAIVKEQLVKLAARYKSGAARPQESELVDLVLTLESQFPGDIGVFCAFLLNYIKLAPGEAIFLSAGEPHAYVSGGESGRLLVYPIEIS